MNGAPAKKIRKSVALTAQEWLMANLHAIHGLPAQGGELIAWPRATRRLCQNLGLAHAALLDRANPTNFEFLGTVAPRARIMSVK